MHWVTIAAARENTGQHSDNEGQHGHKLSCFKPGKSPCSAGGTSC